MATWRPVSCTPDDPVGVELFYGKMRPIKDQHGNVLQMPAYRDFRRDLAYWDGKTFRELDTGHCVFESWRADEQKPTHWRVLPEPPMVNNRLKK